MRLIIDEHASREVAAEVVAAIHGREVTATQVAHVNGCADDVAITGYLSPTTAGFDLHSTATRSLDAVPGDVAMYYWSDVPRHGPALIIDVA